jgi:hypothetical protein
MDLDESSPAPAVWLRWSQIHQEKRKQTAVFKTHDHYVCRAGMQWHIGFQRMRWLALNLGNRLQLSWKPVFLAQAVINELRCGAP